jgi:hypothetical protein
MAIQQHPVPQDISNYRFRLIGDMTIKQFSSLGICIVLTVIIYSSPLPFFFKYPLSFAFLALGVGMAFIPVQGRTLDVWILAFFKSIYAPTQYIWKHGQDVNNNPISTTTPPVQEPVAAPTTPVIPVSTPTAEPIPEQAPQPKVVAESVQQPEPEVKNIDIPVTEVTPVVTENKSVDESISTPLPEPTQNSAPIPNNPINNEVSSLPIPFTPSTPNTLVGLTLTPDEKILDGVLIEIKSQNLTLRATKSNKLGQFLFARPLENGLFQILAEKEGYTFEVYSINLTGEIVKPLKIQALSK